MSLTTKQKRFVEEYLVDFNATQAAVRSGYSEKTARSIAAENLSKPYIQDYIYEQQKRLQAKTEITRHDLVEQLKNIGFIDVDPENVKPGDKIKAIEVMAKILGYDRPDNLSLPQTETPEQSLSTEELKRLAKDNPL